MVIFPLTHEIGVVESHVLLVAFRFEGCGGPKIESCAYPIDDAPKVAPQMHLSNRIENQNHDNERKYLKIK